MADLATRVVYIHPSPGRQELRGAKMLARFLGVSERQVHVLKRAGLPVWTTGRGSPLRGDRDELLTWWKSRREAATNA